MERCGNWISTMEMVNTPPSSADCKQGFFLNLSVSLERNAPPYCLGGRNLFASFLHPSGKMELGFHNYINFYLLSIYVKLTCTVHFHLGKAWKRGTRYLWKQEYTCVGWRWYWWSKACVKELSAERQTHQQKTVLISREMKEFEPKEILDLWKRGSVQHEGQDWK